jgi:hypothetical protein
MLQWMHKTGNGSGSESVRKSRHRRYIYGRGDRIVPGDNNLAVKMERMPDEEMEKGFPLGERFGGEQFPTKYQSYTTGGIIYDDFTAPEHVDDIDFRKR